MTRYPRYLTQAIFKQYLRYYDSFGCMPVGRDCDHILYWATLIHTRYLRIFFPEYAK